MWRLKSAEHAHQREDGPAASRSSACRVACRIRGLRPLVRASLKVGRSLGKLPGKFEQVQVVIGLKSFLTNIVLLKMMMLAKADRPFIRRLEAQTSVGAAANMGAHDRPAAAAPHRAEMPPDPCPMRSAGAGGSVAPLLRKQRGKAELRHPRPSSRLRFSCSFDALQ